MILTEMGEKPEGLRLTSASRVAEPAAYLTRTPRPSLWTMSGPDCPVTFRHREMVTALDAATVAVNTPLSESDRLDGWNDESLGEVRRWLDDCQSHLRQSAHPVPRMSVSWVRGWDGMPGRAFDPKVGNARRSAILRASTAIGQVLRFETLWRDAAQLERQLQTGGMDGGVNERAAHGIVQWLHDLQERMKLDHPVTRAEIEEWKDFLTRYGVHWTGGFQAPWSSDERPERFWEDQPGEPWTTLGPIVIEASNLDWEHWDD